MSNQINSQIPWWPCTGCNNRVPDIYSNMLVLTGVAMKDYQYKFCFVIVEFQQFLVIHIFISLIQASNPGNTLYATLDILVHDLFLQELFHIFPCLSFSLFCTLCFEACCGKANKIWLLRAMPSDGINHVSKHDLTDHDCTHMSLCHLCFILLVNYSRCVTYR